MLVYLAGAIDGVSKEDAEGWRETATHQLLQRRIATYNPAAAFQNVEMDDAGAVHRIDREAIETCDGMIARVSPGCFGTIREVEYASLAGKVVVIWDDGYGLNGHLETQDTFITTDLLTACHELRNQLANPNTLYPLPHVESEEDDVQA